MLSVYTYIYIKKKSFSSVVEGRPKSVVVFLNPIGGSANSLPIYKKDVEPIFRLAGIKCELVGMYNY